MIALKPALSTIWAALAATVSASCCMLPIGDERRRIAGYVYHYINGPSFGLLYTVLAGRPRWY